MSVVPAALVVRIVRVREPCLNQVLTLYHQARSSQGVPTSSGVRRRAGVRGWGVPAGDCPDGAGGRMPLALATASGVKSPTGGAVKPIPAAAPAAAIGSRGPPRSDIPDPTPRKRFGSQEPGTRLGAGAEGSGRKDPGLGSRPGFDSPARLAASAARWAA